jgi:hypothetical protein
MHSIQTNLPTVYRHRWRLLGVAAIAVLLFISGEIRQQRKAKDLDKFRNIARTLVVPAERAAESKDFSKFLIEAKAFVARENALDVSIYDTEGHCLTHSFFSPGADIPNQRGSTLGEYASRTKDGSEQTWEYQDSGPATVFFIFPVRNKGQILGSLQVEFPSERIFSKG